ncbi:MAG: nickel pincer cofactor biosynthesis protein LarC [Fimbriimonadales bacterium]
MKLAYLDCIGGIAGDMTLAALIEAGVSETELLDALRTLPLSGWQWRSERVEIEAIFARRVFITHDEDQPHRHLSDVLEVIERGDLPLKVKQDAGAVFRRLAEAEAAVHNTTPERIHFHEVGAVDAILDVVGACWGFYALGVERIVCSPLPMGRGFVQAAHGALPLPAPAVAELLRGVPTYGVPIQGETVTPTGAAIAVALCQRFGLQPPMRWEQIGYGAGHADRPLPNLLRLFVGESTDALQTPAGDWESIVQIETNLDNATPQQLGYVMERALEQGALDVFMTPVQMKKNRPGVLLTVLASPERADPLMRLLLRETPTLGVRYSLMNRRCLQRDYLPVETAYGTVRVKRARMGARVLHLAPEYDDCVALARQHGAPLHAIMQDALRKAHESGD